MVDCALHLSLRGACPEATRQSRLAEQLTAHRCSSDWLSRTPRTNDKDYHVLELLAMTESSKQKSPGKFAGAFSSYQ
jgi:hypothetical protein